MTRFDLLYRPSIRHIRHAFPPPFRHPSAIPCKKPGEYATMKALEIMMRR